MHARENQTSDRKKVDIAAWGYVSATRFSLSVAFLQEGFKRLTGRETARKAVFLGMACLVSSGLLSSSAMANDMAELVNHQPPDQSGPTPVNIGITLLDLFEVSEPEQSFRVRCYLSLKWMDPRLSFDSDEAKATRKVYLEEIAGNKLDQIWRPDIEFTNELGRRVIGNRELIIYSNGEVEYRETFEATFEARFDLHQFPLDTQRLTIQVESFAYAVDDLVWSIDTENSGIDATASLHLLGWSIIDNLLEVKEHQEGKHLAMFSKVEFSFEIERLTFFYFSRIFFPFAFFILLSTCVFWLERDSLDRRVSIVFSANLTAVAFGFVVARQLPRVPYLTVMDQLVISGYIMTGVCVAAVITFERFKRAGNEHVWAKGNAIARFAMPLLYIAAWSAVLVFR